MNRKRLVDLVRNCYLENRRRYGTRRMSQALGKTGVKIGRGYDNRVRLHSSLGDKSPIEFEMELQTKNGGNERQFFI